MVRELISELKFQYKRAHIAGELGGMHRCCSLLQRAQQYKRIKNHLCTAATPLQQRAAPVHSPDPSASLPEQLCPPVGLPALFLSPSLQPAMPTHQDVEEELLEHQDQPENPEAELPENPDTKPPENLHVLLPEHHEGELPENPQVDLPEHQQENPEAEYPENPEAELPENPEAELLDNPKAEQPENPEAKFPENPEAKGTENPEAELRENLEAELPETIVETDKGNHQHSLTGDSTIKLPFRRKTPKRKKIKLGHKRKASIYDWKSAKDALGLDTQAHNLQVYSAAVSSGVAVETPTVSSPTKEEVKAENSLLKEDAVECNQKICELELKNKSAARNSKRMKLQVLSLSDSLKAEKKKSRAAIK